MDIEKKLDTTQSYVSELLTPQEVALRLGCGLTSVYKLMAHGELAYVEYLRKRRIEPAAVDDFVARHRIAPRAFLRRRWGRKDAA